MTIIISILAVILGDDLWFEQGSIVIEGNTSDRSGGS
jgi:hypothetical protein